MITRNIALGSCATVGLLFLAGCGGSDKAEVVDVSVNPSSSNSVAAGSGEVLLSIDGKPVITADKFEEHKQMAAKGNQQLQMLLAMMPDAEYNILFKNMANQQIIKAWGEKNGVASNPGFIKEREQIRELMDLQLFMKYFEEAHPIHVTDKEVKQFYDEKKEAIPGLVVNPGGYALDRVNFTSKDAANAFLAKVKGKSAAEFKAVAKAENVTVADMKVNQQSHVNPALKTRVLSMTKLPQQEMVKVGQDSYWVINVISKEEPEYRSFDAPEVKQGLREMLIQQQKEKEYEKQIAKLRSEYKVEENKAYFDKKNSDKQQATQHAMKQAEKRAKHSEKASSSTSKPARKSAASKAVDKAQK